MIHMKVFLVTSFVFTLVAAHAWAKDGHPFLEGTEKVRLTSEERASLLEYAANSKRTLERALESAQGKNFEAARRIYVTAAKTVVLDSYKARPREELLLRYALNQALALTYGVPARDGRSVEAPGLLRDLSNQNVLTIILEDSIELAMQHYQSDLSAADQGELVDLPYMTFAFQRLVLARKWLTAIAEPELQYAFSIEALRQWQNTALAADQMHRTKFAVEITKVDRALGEGLQSLSNRPLEEKIRLLRALMRKITELQRAKLAADGAPEASWSDGAEWHIERQESGSRDGDANPTEDVDQTSYFTALDPLDAKPLKIEAHILGGNTNAGQRVGSVDGSFHYGKGLDSELWGLGTDLSAMLRYNSSAPNGIDQATIQGDFLVGMFGSDQNTKGSKFKAELHLLPIGGYYRSDQPVGFSAGGARFSILGLRGQTALKIDGTRLDLGASLEPYMMLSTKHNFQPLNADGSVARTSSGGALLKTSVYAGVRLGKVGQLRDKISYELLDVDGTYERFENLLELRRIGGTRFGATWQHSNSRLTTDGRPGARTNSTNMFGIGGEF